MTCFEHLWTEHALQILWFCTACLTGWWFQSTEEHESIGIIIPELKITTYNIIQLIQQLCLKPPNSIHQIWVPLNSEFLHLAISTSTQKAFDREGTECVTNLATFSVPFLLGAYIHVKPRCAANQKAGKSQVCLFLSQHSRHAPALDRAWVSSSLPITSHCFGEQRSSARDRSERSDFLSKCGLAKMEASWRCGEWSGWAEIMQLR